MDSQTGKYLIIIGSAINVPIIQIYNFIHELG